MKTVEKNEDIPTLRLFVYFWPDDSRVKVELDVCIPLKEPLNEYVARIISHCQLPCQIYDDLLGELKKFVTSETTKWHDEIYTAKLKSATDDDIEKSVKHWESRFRTEHAAYADAEGTSDAELLALMYHKLVHSPHLEAILHTEQSFAETAKSAANKKQLTIEKLTDKQNLAMAQAMKELGSDIGVSEREINALAAKQLEQHSLINGRLSSELEALHTQQRDQYTLWLTTIIQQMTIDPTPMTSPVTSPMSHAPPLPPLDDGSRWPEHEESFTIHLGSQLKQMHNVRIMSAQVLDFCSVKSQISGGVDSRRVQTALGLYSTGLSALVLLSDVGPVGGFSGVLSDVTDVCQQTTELHFPSITDQLQAMKAPISEAVQWRSQQRQIKKPVSKNLQPGDVYITRHSNLAQVHVLFHMITDDSVKSNEMNSRHPVILGLRNVMKTASNHDVTTLTIPLLLMHEMTEEMTVAWCTRRAELVFKCVKGFMMEGAGGGGAQLDNLQFLLPRDISPQVFSLLSAMLPTIFREANPLVIKTTPTPSPTS